MSAPSDAPVLPAGYLGEPSKESKAKRIQNLMGRRCFQDNNSHRSLAHVRSQCLTAATQWTRRKNRSDTENEERHRELSDDCVDAGVGCVDVWRSWRWWLAAVMSINAVLLMTIATATASVPTNTYDDRDIAIVAMPRPCQAIETSKATTLPPTSNSNSADANSKLI